MSQQITTFTFFRFTGFRNKLWAFKMMQFAHSDLGKVEGLKFYKLLGSGKGLGFNPLPDWSVYTLLQVWDNQAQADLFFKNNDLFHSYQKSATDIWTLYTRNIIAKGSWTGANPFEKSDALNKSNSFIVVITRATIKTNKLIAFWRSVPASHAQLHANKGLIYTKGIGEVPLVQMATFSLWKDAESLKQFAYKSAEHKEAIAKTRALNWFKEDLFSRFQPYLSKGTWSGINPLPDLE
ncbi:MAG: DUF3291 domain-containing protein [Bacteroidia bacterium]|nr:DUF3291 domain-containing protein [Bacteroidia bacterium]